MARLREASRSAQRGSRTRARFLPGSTRVVHATLTQESRGKVPAAVDKHASVCRNADTQPNGGIRMTDRSFRAITLGLLASTALATPAFAQNAQPQTTGQSPAPATNATDVTAPPPAVQQAQTAQGQADMSEIVITATKREENLQNVPISVTVLGNRKLDQ